MFPEISKHYCHQVLTTCHWKSHDLLDWWSLKLGNLRPGDQARRTFGDFPAEQLVLKPLKQPNIGEECGVVRSQDYDLALQDYDGLEPKKLKEFDPGNRPVPSSWSSPNEPSTHGRDSWRRGRGRIPTFVENFQENAPIEQEAADIHPVKCGRLSAWYQSNWGCLATRGHGQSH